jgi:hypothetical protein
MDFVYTLYINDQRRHRRADRLVVQDFSVSRAAQPAETIVLVNPERNYAQFLLRTLNAFMPKVGNPTPA